MIADTSPRRRSQRSSTMPTSPTARIKGSNALHGDTTEAVLMRKGEDRSGGALHEERLKQGNEGSKASEPREGDEPVDEACKQQLQQTIQTIITAGSSTFDVDLDDNEGNEKRAPEKTERVGNESQTDGSSTVVDVSNVEDDFLMAGIMNQKSTDTYDYDFNMEDMDIQIGAGDERRDDSHSEHREREQRDAMDRREMGGVDKKNDKMEADPGRESDERDHKWRSNRVGDDRVSKSPPTSKNGLPVLTLPHQRAKLQSDSQHSSLPHMAKRSAGRYGYPPTHVGSSGVGCTSRKKRALSHDDEHAYESSGLRQMHRSNSHDSAASNATTRSNSSHQVHNISMESVTTVNTSQNFTAAETSTSNHPGSTFAPSLGPGSGKGEKGDGMELPHHRRQSSSSTTSSLSMGGLSMSNSYESQGGNKSKGNFIEPSPSKRSRHDSECKSVSSKKHHMDGMPHMKRSHHNRSNSQSSTDTAGTTHSRFEMLSMDDNCSTSTTNNMLPPSHHNSHQRNRRPRSESNEAVGSNMSSSSHSTTTVPRSGRVLQVSTGGSGGGAQTLSASPIMGAGVEATSAAGPQTHATPVSKNTGRSRSDHHYGHFGPPSTRENRYHSTSEDAYHDSHARPHRQHPGEPRERENSFTPIPFQTSSGNMHSTSHSTNHSHYTHEDSQGPGITSQLSWSIMGDTSPLGENFDAESWNSGYSSRHQSHSGGGSRHSGFWKEDETGPSHPPNYPAREDGMELGSLSPAIESDRVRSPPLPMFYDRPSHSGDSGSTNRDGFRGEDDRENSYGAPSTVRSSSSGQQRSSSYWSGSHPPPQRSQYGENYSSSSRYGSGGRRTPPSQKKQSTHHRQSASPHGRHQSQNPHPLPHLGGPTNSWSEYSTSSSTVSSQGKSGKEGRRAGTSTSSMSYGGSGHSRSMMPHNQGRYTDRRDDSASWSGGGSKRDAPRNQQYYNSGGGGGGSGQHITSPVHGGHRHPPPSHGPAMGPPPRTQGSMSGSDRVTNLRGRAPPPNYHHPPQPHSTPSHSRHSHHHPPHPIHTDSGGQHHRPPVGGKLPHTPMSSAPSSWHPHPSHHPGHMPHMFGADQHQSYHHQQSLMQMHSKRKCVPLKPPIPSKFQGDITKFKDAPVPEFTALVNFPAHMSSKLSLSLGEGMKCCVMCGQACPCSSANKGKNKSNDVNNNAKDGKGGNNSYSQGRGATGGLNAIANKQTTSHGTYAIIPTQNKGLCTFCDVNVWVVLQSGLEIKWCKGCKNFRPWAAFGDKGLATKCVRCRERQREKYALQKEEKERGARAKGANAKGSNNKKVSAV